MFLKSFLTKLFKGYEVLETVNSPINGEIKVVDDLFGGRSMIIGGISQSGGLVTKLWEMALTAVSNEQSAVSKCLILGLGCGNAAKIVSEKFPGCKIVGVEIDPKVVEVGKKYFGLGEIPNLEIIIDDAIKKILNTYFLILNTKFDLILVDLYLGRNYPKEAESKQFIGGIKGVLSENGIVIFNRLCFGEYKKGAENFAEDLRNYFPKVWTKKAITNLLIFCKN